MERTAPVFNIQKFCTHDGKGIRTTVFLKGCNMLCEWCANPESQKKTAELLFYEEKCKYCASCVATCEQKAISLEAGKIVQNRVRCINCGKCVEECYFNARALLGEEMTAAEVFEEVVKDKVFYEQSGGGVTFSGGEPLLHVEFICQITRKCREEGIHVSVETCGCFPEEYVDMVAEAADVLLFDLKIIDDEKHNKYCGCTNAKLLRNFRHSCELTCVQPRVPIIPGINDTVQNIRQLAEFLNSCHTDFKVIHLLPYHNLGVCKYDAMGKEYALSHIKIPSDAYMRKIKKEFEGCGFEICIGG